MNNGLFIAFEGIDGSGKSTQLRHTAAELDKKGIPHIVTREPGGTRISERVRDIIISPEHAEMTHRCELLLYLAARAQHIEELIVPSVEKGYVVLCDRFELSTFAYQGFGRDIPLEILRNFNSYATGTRAPDFTFLFDLSADMIARRLARAGKRPDRIEHQTNTEFFSRIREGYIALAHEISQRCMLLDATEERAVLSAKVTKKIEALYHTAAHA